MKQENIRFFFWVIVFCLALVGAATLTGCSKDDLTYVGCLARDNTKHPCQ